jgi:sortase A
MIKLGINKRKASKPEVLPASDKSAYVQVGGRVRVHRRGKALRVLGNLLILTGVLMLLGIGGWYGYTQWNNERYKEELVAKFGPGSVDPPLVAEEPTPTPYIPPPLPVLNDTDIGTGMLGIINRQPQDIDNTPPVRLQIPVVNIDSKIVPVTWQMIPTKDGVTKSEWQVADYAVGHHAGSAHPGEMGNVVLSGHVDYKGQVFKDLDKVNKGDEVTVYTMKGQYLYVVSDIKLVQEEGVSEEQKRRNAAFMNPTPDQTLTMITCWPYGIDTHRLIVIAKPYQSSLSAQSEFLIR